MKSVILKKDLQTLTKYMDMGNLDGYTFVRRDGILDSFKGIGMEVKDLKNQTEATVYLKELFADYADQYPELFAKPDRYSVNNSEMFSMINKWAQDNNIPYAGWQNSNGNHHLAGDKLYAWLPVRVAGKFAYVLSDSDSEEAYFDCGYEDDANLSVSFRASDSPINPFTDFESLSFRTFKTGANRDSNRGKLEYHNFIHPLSDYNYAVYMRSKQIIGGEYRRGDNRQKGLGIHNLFESFCRHVETVKLLMYGHDVYEYKLNGVTELAVDPIDIDPTWEKKELITELNGCRFNSEGMKLEILLGRDEVDVDRIKEKNKYPLYKIEN